MVEGDAAERIQVEWMESTRRATTGQARSIAPTAEAGLPRPFQVLWFDLGHLMAFLATRTSVATRGGVAEVAGNGIIGEGA